MTFPIVTDPWFYAVAVPAVLMMGLSKSGFATGFGSLAAPDPAPASDPPPDAPPEESAESALAAVVDAPLSPDDPLFEVCAERRSILAQPVPLNTIAGAVMALRMVVPQCAQSRAVPSWTPCRISTRWPQFGQT